ncbi:MAG: helicase-related protein [Candidatus Woesearchaeota archaeon]
MDEISTLVLETLNLDKQVIIFVNSKRGAESQAEKVSKIIKSSSDELINISNSALSALTNPTRQCKRLAMTLKKGVAFHHSGLSSKQRDLVEDNFKQGKIKVICATPTLAAGVDLPAFRVIIRDVKRYTGFGMSFIPVLEYEQQAGRAGRPSYDNEGQAVLIAKDPIEREELWSRYVNGKPENIYSKLAVEPVLRIYVLSLVSSGFVRSFEDLLDFMSNTFYAHQYGDMVKLKMILSKIVRMLVDWSFLEADEFNLSATVLGRRISELYLDPYTANYLLENFDSDFEDFGVLQLISYTLEMRPLIRTKKADEQIIFDRLINSELLVDEPDSYSDEFEEFLNSVKTAVVLEDWMNEVHEDILYEKYGVTPGELNAKLERGNWLLYSLYELLKIRGYKNIGGLLRVQTRLKFGVKEELLPLLRLKGIGRVRARKLFVNKVKDLGDVKKVDVTTLTQILGPSMAKNVKEQVGIKVEVVKQNKRKGQINLNDFT